MSDEDDIDDEADLESDFYDDDSTDLSGTTVDEALATNFDRKSSRQMLEEILEMIVHKTELQYNFLTLQMQEVPHLLQHVLTILLSI